MKHFLITTLFAVPTLLGQFAEPRISAEDRKTTDRQAAKIFKALRAVSFKAREVAYPIYADRERIAYGVSIGEEEILTKASEVARRGLLFSANRDGEALAATIKGIYPEHDLAILAVPGLKAKTAEWADAENLDEGAFLAAIRSDGEAQAMGVLSVRERSLKSTDQGFLGIQMSNQISGNDLDDGVRVEAVVKKSAAAEVGIKVGDVITEIGGEKVRGFYELSTRLRRLKSGEQPEIALLRNGKSLKVKPTLKGRDVEQQQSRRLNRMDRMSGSQSRVRGEFGNVLQSDMELEANDAGLPVVDLEGRVVGIVIARAGRISTLILPGDDIAAVLKVDAQPYVKEQRSRRRANSPEGASRDRMKKELDLMDKMMEKLREELERE